MLLTVTHIVHTKILRDMTAKRFDLKNYKKHDIVEQRLFSKIY
jgi:hypothetical protein